MSVASPREAATRRLQDLEPLAEEHRRLVSALLILAEGESKEYQDSLWAKYVASSSSGRAGPKGPSPLPDPVFAALLELLDPADTP